mgnify:CR=1 FL=1
MNSISRKLEQSLARGLVPRNDAENYCLEHRMTTMSLSN